MPIEFPHYEEIPLANPPLAEVVCQVRFPPILRIGKEEPSDFQELVRTRFPQLEWQQGLEVKLPGPGNESEPAARVSARIYRFITQDEDSFISIAPDFYALTARQYRHWNTFAEDLELVARAVRELYEPSYATRIGLRYINRFTLANTDTSTKDELLGLLRTELTALLRGEVWENAESLVSRVLFVDESGARLNLSAGYETKEQESAFLLDFDHFEEGKLPLGGLVERCNRYHEMIYDAFRWCVREQALERFGARRDGV